MKRMSTLKKVQIYLLTILDGSSLIYTSVSVPNTLPTLIHSSLGIYSLLKKSTLKHNIIDRDKILVPPNWDSWGKIRVLREGFDVEGISNGWNVDIRLPLTLPEAAQNSDDAEGATNGESDNQVSEHESSVAEGSILPIYEATITDPQKDRMPQSSRSATKELETECESMQTFLESQLKIIEDLKKDEEKAAAKDKDKSSWRPATTGDVYNSSSDSTLSSRQISSDDSRVHEHIGPVQFNVGGIQVDPEDMVQRIKSREWSAARTSGEKSTPKESHTPTPSTPQKQDPKAQNEALANFFAGLMKKERTTSPRGERTNQTG